MSAEIGKKINLWIQMAQFFIKKPVFSQLLLSS